MDAILEFFSALPRELYVFVISVLPIVELRGSIPVGAALGMPFYWNYILSVVGNLLPVPFILLFITKFMDFLRKFKTFRPVVDWIRRKADKYSTKVIKDEPENSAVTEIETTAIEAIENAETEIETTAIEATESEAIENAGTESSAIAENGAATQIEAVSESGAALENSESASKEDEKTPTGKIRKMTLGVFAALMMFVAIPLPGTGAWTGALIASVFNLPKRHSLLAVALGVLVSGTIITLISYGVLGFLSWLI